MPRIPFLSFLLPTLLLWTVAQSQPVIQDGWFVLDGEKAFLKCIGFETHTRPGQAPWVYSFDADVMAADLERIKQAGFNTIRTWGELTEEELQIVEASGLKILFGIWIDPAGPWDKRGFEITASNLVRRVLTYSKRYSSIIGYVIMNEPTLDHIHDAGAAELASLWQTVVELIHDEHPGVPVSVSNTTIHDFVRTDLFDFAGYNMYIYNPTTITYSHGYQGFVEFLKGHRASTIPLVVTEYGLSVSPGTTGLTYGYGGNTPQQQLEGNLLMYRGMIDGGAQGGCVFQYYDGWWKAGNETVHDPTPEEWFGLWHFDDPAQPDGAPRPAWEAFTSYNKAIITSPRNGAVYTGAIPLEFFVEPDVVRVMISSREEVVYDTDVSTAHVQDEITLPADEPITDAQLAFFFFDASMDTLKSEIITILHTVDEIDLPHMEVSIVPDVLQPGVNHRINVEASIPGPFEVAAGGLDFAMHPHIGFDPGAHANLGLGATEPTVSSGQTFGMPRTSLVATFGAGLTVTYGAFTRRLYDQQIRIAGDWADGLAYEATATGSAPAPTVESFSLDQNYPNPFRESTSLSFTLAETGFVHLSVFDLLGRKVAVLADGRYASGEHDLTVDLSDLPPGTYAYRLSAGNRSDTRVMTTVR